MSAMKSATHSPADRRAATATVAGDRHVRELAALAGLLLGAAHADGFYSAEEAVAINEILSQYVDDDDLPASVRRAMTAFDRATFDVPAAVGPLTLRTTRDREDLLDLVVTVMRADGVLQPEEMAYARAVAQAVGLGEHVLDELAAEVDEVDAAERRLDEGTGESVAALTRSLEP